jgi:hypothetical protein
MADDLWNTQLTSNQRSNVRGFEYFRLQIHLQTSKNSKPFVTVKLSLNFIIGCWGYTLDREYRVS